jgi:oxygen-independent coproporphyrinogen-3 oxidase
VDLVYGLPRQSEETMARSVADLARLGPDRVDCVAFNRRARVFRHQRGIDVADMPSLADKLSLFNSIVDGFEDAGYTWVGLDCFARNGDPLVQAQNDGRLSRSWLGYSDHRSEQLIGFGTHAVSELAGLNTQNHFELADWHGALDSGHLPIRGGIRLSAAQQTRRDLLRELMCNLSVNGADVVLEGSNGEFHRFVNDGSMAVRGNRLSITEQGRIALHHLWSDSSSRLRWAIGV